MGRFSRKCNLCGVGSILEKNKRSRLGKIACNICDQYFFGTSAYVIMLGLVGTVITGFDIIRIMNSKSLLRCASRQRGGDVVPMDVERDLKLMTSILGIEHYTLIMLGAITEYPMLHTPWLLMQLCVILVEIIVFFIRLFLDGLHIKRDEIMLAFVAVHNWMQVFCLFHSQARTPTL
ncbi:uncharacterized protein LOC105685332 isoform X4 [Athalia rosae]|uniref:uncharacterized protein LOC105685332 isoform X4 n=1 Tax=Athalia rosae TaxID=37344 RepID=UPI0020344E1B|nr:uncharacterized protein LOC105685332 isoform X4 [Athalia rosae]